MKQELIRDLRELPNQEGFRFIGVMKDGSQVEKRVLFNIESGRYYVPGYTDMVGWIAVALEKGRLSVVILFMFLFSCTYQHDQKVLMDAEGNMYQLRACKSGDEMYKIDFYSKSAVDSLINLVDREKMKQHE